MRLRFLQVSFLGQRPIHVKQRNEASLLERMSILFPVSDK